MGATRGLLQIGDVAERTGLSLRTIRHYEEVGLLPASERSPGGFRLYTDGAVARLLVIKQMKPLDFSLEQMRAVLDLLDELEVPALASTRRSALRAALAEHHHMVAERVAGVREQLSNAEAFHTTLTHRLQHVSPLAPPLVES